MASALSDFDSHAPFAGKYQVVRVLGAGGMGTVFEARHLRTGHRCAIKVLGSTLRHFPDLVKRFEREARACGALTSANAVKVHDIDTTEDGTPYLVMELLSGADLSSVITNEGPQPVGRASRWVLDACEALAEAHSLGIVHRDLKPSNLFVADVEGVPVLKVLDFGIAKVRQQSTPTPEKSLTYASTPLGTPQYMSPEQVRCAKDVDARTDVWSLGVTLYELVCGRTPFANVEEPSAIIAAVVADPILDPRTFVPDLPADFADVIMRALEKNVDARYESIEAFANAIAPFANAGAVSFARMKVSNAETLAAPRASEASIPAISDLPEPFVPRRRGRNVAMACAAMLGLAALVIPTLARSSTPVATLGAPSMPRMHMPVIVPEVPAPTKVVAEIEPAPVPETVQTADLPKAPVMIRPSPSQQLKKDLASQPAPKKVHVADMTVHGGLSGSGL